MQVMETRQVDPQRPSAVGTSSKALSVERDKCVRRQSTGRLLANDTGLGQRVPYLVK